jgi:hypothetical protein
MTPADVRPKRKRGSSRSTASLAPSLGLTFHRAGKRRRRSYGKIVALFALSRALIAFRFLYAIFLAIDACFRLKRKKISSWHADPSISDGWAYFTRSVEYLEFVKTLGEQKEVSLYFEHARKDLIIFR